MTDINQLAAIATNVGRVLYAIASGQDMTKLEIRERTGLSMSTVISGVEELVRREWITFTEVKGARGGKMRSVINVHPMRRVYGVSYKSGVLTAVAVDLKGEIRESISREVAETSSPPDSVLALTNALRESAPEPIAIALSLNCEEKEVVFARLRERFQGKVLPSTNTAAIAYLSLWRGAELPILSLGLGNRVKCVFLEERGCRHIELGELRSPCLVTEEGSIQSALSALNVEEILRRSNYRGKYYIEGGSVSEIRDLGEYSRALALAVAALIEGLTATLSPHSVFLFGEYLSEAFFERIEERTRWDAPTYLSPDREMYALGTALYAMTEEVFTR